MNATRRFGAAVAPVLVVAGVLAWGSFGAAWSQAVAGVVQTQTPAATPSAGPPSEVFLAFTAPVASDPADPCRTGTTYKQNSAGDHDDVVVCTYDGNGAPSPTDASTAHLQWAITRPYDGSPGIRFNPSPPPDETTGDAATATAGIDAFEQIDDNVVTVSLLDGSGGIVDSFSIEKDVKSTPENLPVPTRLTAHRDGKLIGGRAVSAEPRCEPGRQVDLYRRRKGPDVWVGSDTTNRSGEWGVLAGFRRGTYYARVMHTTIATDDGGERTCQADQSNDVRRG